MQGGTGDGPWDRSLGDPDGLISTDAARFDRWLADLRVDEDARRRTRRHWMRAAAGEETTLAGVLLDLAERDVPIVVSTQTGRRHQGSIAVVGADFVGIRAGPSRHVVIALQAIAIVRPPPSSPVIVGDRSVESPLVMSEVIVALAAEQSRVALRIVPDVVVEGELRSVGADVALVATRTDGSSPVYVRLDSITEVTIEGPIVTP